MTSIRRSLVIFVLALSAGLPADAQSTAEPALALRGIDVVSYFQPGGPVKGQAAWRHDFDGARYLFSGAQNKAAFVADPDRWLPQFDGLCTAGLSKGFIGQSDPMVWKIVGGRLYLFSTAERMPSDAQAAETVARARENWGKRKSGVWWRAAGVPLVSAHPARPPRRATAPALPVLGQRAACTRPCAP